MLLECLIILRTVGCEQVCQNIYRPGPMFERKLDLDGFIHLTNEIGGLLGISTDGEESLMGISRGYPDETLSAILYLGEFGC